MKNILLGLNIVLLIAVGVLFYLQFSEPKSEEKEPGIMQAAEYSVAYINSDSVMKKYDFVIKQREQLQEKTKKMESEYQARAQGLQREVTEYQRNINNLTIGQAKALEEDLMKKQQNLRMYQESLGQEIMQEEAKINRELYNRISNYLSEYSKENGLQLVVKYYQGSDVLYASDSMNITKPVIAGLNEVYQNEKNAGANIESDTVSTSK